MVHLAKPSESVSLFAMFSSSLENISMFPDLEMFNKMHENGENNMFGRSTVPMGSASSTLFGGGVAETG